MSIMDIIHPLHGGTDGQPAWQPVSQCPPRPRLMPPPAVLRPAIPAAV